MIYILGPTRRKKDHEDFIVINTTSRSGSWSCGLSPFLIGPCLLYDNYISYNMENAWQYSKVYREYLKDDGNIKKSYFKWAKSGWYFNRANRYPMGKGAKPEFSYWDGERLKYIEARMEIYIPLYARAVSKTISFKKLKKIYKKNTDIGLWDFDGYDYIKFGLKNIQDVIYYPNRPMGHAFVLKMLLEGDIEIDKKDTVRLFGNIISKVPIILKSKM